MAGPIKTNDYNSMSYYFMNFDSREEFDKLGKEAYAEMSKQGNCPKWSTSVDKDFVGSSDRALLDEGNFKEFINRPALDKTIDSFEELFATIDMGGAFNKSRLIITDDKRGIFDFGLASKGLYRAQEYYSKELAEESPDEFFPEKPSGVVPWEFIEENQLDQYWFTSKIVLDKNGKGKRFQMFPQQEGTRALELKIPGAKLIFRTNIKKSYVTFERQGGKARMVDLYMPQGGLAGLSYEGMLAKALPLMLAARYFEMAGIKTRINNTRMYYDGSKVVCVTFPVKDYGEDLDFNWLAINSADPRFFRWNMWKYTSGLLAKKYGIRQSGWGSTVYGGSMMTEVGNRYKNWYFEEMRKGLQPELSIDRRLMLFGGLENPGNSIKNQIEDIKQEFFRILDIVDFQFNSPEKAAQRVFVRMVENENKATTTYKRYVQNTMALAYSYPTGGQYATEPEEADVLEQDYDIAIDGMNNFLESLR
jgi:hypothetical protein